MTNRNINIQRIFKLTILAIAAIVITHITLSCSRQKQTGNDNRQIPTITVSIPPLAYFATAIGGDSLNVECLTTASADPETFEPGIKQFKALSESRAFLTIGQLPFEQITGSNIQANNPELQIFSLTDSIEILYGTHGDEGDPHIWTSPRNARNIARNILEALKTVAPEHSDYYTARHSALDHQLDSIDHAISQRLKPYIGTAFLAWHPSLSYFANDYGLKQITVGEEHKEASVGSLSTRLAKAKNENIAVFFFQKEFDIRQAETVSSLTGLKPTIISPMDYNWPLQIELITAAIEKGNKATTTSDK